jgi:uncharacterized protein YndB with AHSA1/START domain
MPSSQVTIRIEIAAGQAEVFEYLANLKAHKRWNSSLQELSSTERLKLGTTYESTSIVLGKTNISRNRVTEFDEGHELRIQNDSGPLTYDVCYKLEADGGKTIMVCECEISGHVSFFNLAAPLLEYMAETKMEADLNALRVLVENHTCIAE